MVRPSDLLGTLLAERDVEFQMWAVAVLQIWNADAALRLEVENVVSFFDYAFEASEQLIRSAFVDNDDSVLGGNGGG